MLVYAVKCCFHSLFDIYVCVHSTIVDHFGIRAQPRQTGLVPTSSTVCQNQHAFPNKEKIKSPSSTRPTAVRLQISFDNIALVVQGMCVRLVCNNTPSSTRPRYSSIVQFCFLLSFVLLYKRNPRPPQDINQASQPFIHKGDENHAFEARTRTCTK